LYPKELYPNGHPDLAQSVNELPWLHQALGDSSKALPLYERALAMQDGLTRLATALAAEAEAINYLASLPLTRDGFLSLPHDRLDTLPTTVYGPVWRNKAALARLLERRHHDALAAADPPTRDTYRRLQDTRRRLAGLLLAPADPDHDRSALLQELTATKERLEREVATQLPAALGRPADGTPADLAARLPARAAFVDLLRYTRFTQDPDKPGQAGQSRTPSYLAFVVAAGQPVQRIDLGPAAPIDDAIQAWRQAIQEETASPAAATLRCLLWQPLEKRLPDGTHTVYLAPDGELCRLPWAALPGAKPDTVLLEAYALAVVPSGPFLLERLAARPPRPRAAGTLLSLGGVAYDDGAASLHTVDSRGLEPARLAERGSAATWAPLAGTGPEAAGVAELATPRPVIRLGGAEAGVARVMADLPRARYAHLATHGFFASPQFRSAFQLDERLFGRTFRDRATPGARNPLVLSGLVLAGANRAAADGSGNSGILTAEGIVGLPLEGLDLAVLSACETGLGEVAGGEGVLGLQRAFHLAGTRDVVASLWQVGDESTAALMAVFYRKLWQDGQPPLEALRQAQLTLYRGSAAQIKDWAARGPDLSKTVALPEAAPAGTAPAARSRTKQWAAFLLSGPGRESR
jgi:CHAT domain-containing protein